MEWVTVNAVVKCGHDGRVQNVATQNVVTVAGMPVLVDNDPENRRIVACPNFGPMMKPCVNTLKVNVGYSMYLQVDGRRIVLSTLDGLTDGTVPGTVHYTVRDAGQSIVRADS